jgi:hypothetical protein
MRAGEEAFGRPAELSKRIPDTSKDAHMTDTEFRERMLAKDPGLFGRDSATKTNNAEDVGRYVLQFTALEGLGEYNFGLRLEGVERIEEYARRRERDQKNRRRALLALPLVIIAGYALGRVLGRFLPSTRHSDRMLGG